MTKSPKKIVSEKSRPEKNPRIPRDFLSTNLLDNIGVTVLEIGVTVAVMAIILLV